MALPAGAGLQGCTHIRAALVHGSGVKQGSFNHDEQDLIEEALKFRHTAEKLKKGERQQVVQAPLAHGEEVLLQRCRERLDRCGYIWPSVEVCYCDLSVIRAATPVEDSLPSLTAPLTRLLKKSKTRSTVKALNSATGVLKPGSMTLVLGPPGSGRSTLMRVLTGRLRSSKMVDIHNSNSIRFNGRTSEQFVMQRTAAYVDQNDYLFPSLTCRETLNFSETCAGVSRNLQRALQQMTVWEKAHPNLATRVDLDDEVDAMLLHMTQSHNLLQTEYALSLLGLQHVGDTLVGDAVLRGVSGGEKRRVAVGEMIVTPANFVVMDEPSTGLDSASTLALAQSMRRWAKLLNSTVMMALLQPEPEVVAQFDDILLLAEGQVVWHGPVKDVLPHFASCGLCPLLGQDLAEFLQQVATVRDQAALLRQQAGHDSAATSGGAVLTPAALSKAFWESQRGLELRAAAEAQLTPDPVQLLSLDTRRTGAPWPVLLAACTRRLFLTDFRRNWEACAIRWSLAFFMAIVTGTLFYQLPQTFSGGVNLLGLLFNALFWMQVLSVPTIEVTFSRRPLLFRQRDELFYPAWVDWLPATLLNVPVLIVDTLVYGIPVYLMADFTRTAAPLFTFLLVLFCFSLLCDNLYRVYGSASKVLSFAIGIGVCQGLINEVLAGFVITPGSIPVYWYWFYYLNPLSYAFRALAINELKQPRWAVPASAQGTAATQTTLGSAILAFFEIDSSFSWVWMGVGVLLAMSVFCAGVALLACKYNRLKESPAVLAHQHDKEQQWQGDKGATATGKKQQPVIEEKVASQDCVAIEMAAGDGHHQDSDSVSAGPAPQLRGISVAFKNLSYCVPSPSGSKGDELQLLHNITGSFRPGKLTALMGSSGAGKTTLMDVVAGRKTAGRTAGDVYVAGHPMRATNFARLSGYVEQTDIHTPLATVSEALAFSAALRSPAASRPQVSAAVSYVLDLVDLTAVSGRLVGTKGVDGLSSEQRKRLTIAVELVTFPSVLFLDEPTSGLDTRSATLIAAVMHNISRQRVTVVATIHQPSQAIFRQFDELLLLKRGGWVVYFGPLGDEGSKLVEYFSTIPQAPELQQGRNLAAWMLEVVGGPQALLPDYPDLAAHYQTSSLAKVALSQVDELLNPKSSAPLAELNPPAQTSSLQQLRLLVHRNQLSYWRNPATNLSRFLVTLAMALIVGSIEWGKGDTSKIRDARGVQNCLGALYMVASALAIEVGFECQQGLSRERVVYYREIAAASYGAGPYLAAQVLVECSYVSAQVVLYTIITYFMVGFELAAAKFFYVMVLVWLCSMVAFCTSQALVQTTPILFIATTLYSLLTNLQSLVSGYTRPLPASSRAWWGAYFLSPSYYTFIGMGSRILGDVTNPILDPTSSTGGTVTVQQYVAAVYGMGSSMYPGPYGSLGILVTISSVMLVVSYLGLRFARFQNR